MNQKKKTKVFLTENNESMIIPVGESVIRFDFNKENEELKVEVRNEKKVLGFKSLKVNTKDISEERNSLYEFFRDISDKWKRKRKRNEDNVNEQMEVPYGKQS